MFPDGILGQLIEDQDKLQAVFGKASISLTVTSEGKPALSLMFQEKASNALKAEIEKAHKDLKLRFPIVVTDNIGPIRKF